MKISPLKTRPIKMNGRKISENRIFVNPQAPLTANNANLPNTAIMQMMKIIVNIIIPFFPDMRANAFILISVALFFLLFCFL